jgi:hypothetical protein
MKLTLIATILSIQLIFSTCTVLKKANVANTADCPDACQGNNI